MARARGILSSSIRRDASCSRRSRLLFDRHLANDIGHLQLDDAADPRRALDDDVSAGRLTAAPIEELSVTWTLVHSRERGLGLAAQKLVELLFEVTALAAEVGRWPGATLLQPSGMDSMPI